MSLGGMALAIGILVDMSTVTIENVHVQMQRTENVSSAVLRGSLTTAVPILLALVCILSVFVPAFIMEDPLRALFMPLTLAVGFAMISSYLLSSTFVPIMSVYLLKHKGEEGPGLFDRILKVYHKAVEAFVGHRWWVVVGYLGACGAILGVLGLQIGTELFPQIDAGEFVLRFRPPPGSSYELTREMGVKCLQEIEHEAGTKNIAITMGFVGQVAPNFGIDNMVLFMRGPDDGWLRIKLKEDSGIKLEEFRERLRKVLRERVIPWLTQRLETGGLPRAEARQQAEQSTFGFEPGDIVSQVMSFGASKPIAIRLVGTNFDEIRKYSEKIANELKRNPFLRDVGFEQTLDYPTLELEVDRELAGLTGITIKHVERALVMSTSSTRFTNLNYWIDEKTGFDYLVQIQVPPLRMEKPEDVETLPLESVNPDVPLMVRDVLKDGRVHTSVRPGEYDRDMSQRYLTVIANVEGEDMGRAARQVREAARKVGEPPRGVRLEEIGQLPSMTKMFRALAIGLAVSVFTILVLLTAFFQSPRLAVISLGAVPGVLAGIVTILYFSNTTLNIESFMGSIMCLGVSVSNSVLMVTFMDEHWKAGRPSDEAAIQGASERLRPILMTACAMTVGMVPMALALERGSQMEAPLGRAVIGGLVMSTFATLLVLPSIFALVIGRQEPRSPSLYPDNPESAHYDPELYGPAHGQGPEDAGGGEAADEEEGL
jgi:multidrug efflux pump subunit AcrB